MDSTIRDPDQVRQTLSTDLVGSLPLVKSMCDKPALALGARRRCSSGGQRASACRTEPRPTSHRLVRGGGSRAPQFNPSGRLRPSAQVNCSDQRPSGRGQEHRGGSSRLGTRAEGLQDAAHRLRPPAPERSSEAQHLEPKRSRRGLIEWDGLEERHPPPPGRPESGYSARGIQLATQRGTARQAIRPNPR